MVRSGPAALVYEGVLGDIDPADRTIGLFNCRMCGSSEWVVHRPVPACSWHSV